MPGAPLKPSRRALFWLLLSFVFWAIVAGHIGGTRAALFDYTDHWSHYGQTVLFFDHGFDGYRVPATSFCAAPSPAAARELPPVKGCEWCVAPGASDARPLCINFQYLCHGYPPGIFLYSLPEVLLFERTSLSLRAINVFSILKYLAVAHLLIWLLFLAVFEVPERDSLVETESGEGWLKAGLFGLLYLEVIKWTLSGFYDPGAAAVVLLGICALRKGRGADAGLAMSAAIFLHFRALWYLPLFPFAAWAVVKNREWQSGGWRFYVKLAVSAAMSGVALYAFALLYPGLAVFPADNAALLKDLTSTTPATWNLLIPLVPVLLYLAWSRQWTFLGCAAWQLFTITRTLNVHEWHLLCLLPVFGLARLEGKRGSMVAATILYLTEAIVIFYNEVPLPGWHLANLIQLWQPWW